jgi:hypothetical protein
MGNFQWSRNTLTIRQVNVLCVLLLVPAPSMQWDAGWVRVLAACLRVIGSGTRKVDQGLTLAIGAKKFFVINERHVTETRVGHSHAHTHARTHAGSAWA